MGKGGVCMYTSVCTCVCVKESDEGIFEEF